MQYSSHILMVRPVNFGFNEETAVNNHFQVRSSETGVNEKAVAEFENLVELLHNHCVDVLVVNDSPAPYTPDSVFPNNWISMHADGTIIYYPMFAANRRFERKPGVLHSLQQHFIVNNTIDLTGYENKGLFLEGTGSMVLDRDHQIAYACLSPRTSIPVLEEYCKVMGYRYLAFHAVDATGSPIYHTNVMMCVADAYAVVCLDSITDPIEKEKLVQSISNSGKEIIPINFEQVNHFAGNMLQVVNKNGEKLLVMSTQAYTNLSNAQIEQITTYNRIIHANISTIEANGGGSARCMMAEIFLPPKT